MSRLHEARQHQLTQFVTWVRAHVTGDEKGEAQIFLDRLFQAFDLKGVREAGATLEMRVKKADDGGTAFADLVYKPIALIEMKKRGVDLKRHYRQAFDYWVRLAPNRPKYVILCNFDEFWVYDFDSAQLDEPLDMVKLEDLPQRWGPMAFLFPTRERPTFGNDHEEVTRKAADNLATCFNKLVARNVERPQAQRFVLQMLVALFAEDIGLLEKYFVTQLLEDCKAPADSFDLLGGLFVAMNTPGKASGGRFKGVDYFNGGLFSEPARLELYSDELAQLKAAAKSDWSKVRPEIFGTLFEHSLDHKERHAFGAHFTSPLDIMKIVGPTIVEPWREQIAAAKTREKLLKLRERMQHFIVLDPACGSGNFLYMAYRELKRLEREINELLQNGFHSKYDPAQRRFGFVTAQQFFGLDINPFAVELAKVTMMIARKLAIDELHVTEPALPLDNLDQNFLVRDALLDAEGNPAPWPRADVIIGNPPFLGAKRLKPERGPDYVNAVRKAYPAVPGMADYCVYWFRKAHEQLPPCTKDDPLAGRAGLVGTQNIRNNKSREGGLDYIVQTGTIVEAVDNQPWSGEANVHVSIVNWINANDKGMVPKVKKLWFPAKSTTAATKLRKRGSGPAHKQFELEFRNCTNINSSLSCETDISNMSVLESNKRPKRCFQGKIPGYDGFVLSSEQRAALGRESAAVVFPYLTGRELLDEFVISRWIIDFGNRDILAASQFASAFEHCRRYVLPKVEAALRREQMSASDMIEARQEHLSRWWQLWNRRDELTTILKRAKRIIGCSRVTRRPILVFLSARICPSDLIQVFAFNDDYSFGVLQSSLHFELFRKSSRLKVESDKRYSVRDVFEKFPWPQSPTKKQISAVAKAGRLVRKVRADALPKIKGGLRALYRTLELPGANPLKDAHAALDEAVLEAYGFAPKKDLLAQLLELNLAVARRIEMGEAVVAPGIPPSFPDPQSLVTEDCIQP